MRTTLVLVTLLALGGLACDLNGSGGDAAPSLDDSVAGDAAVGMDAVPDGPPRLDTAEDVAPPPDIVEDLPPPPDVVEDTAELPPSCCLSDEDCAEVGDGGWTCAWGEMQALDPDWGRCMGPLTWDDGLCWDDGDCPDGQICTGAFYCPCDQPCGAPDVPGQCQAPDELGEVGDLCGPDGGYCQPELVCCYPCGIPGCQWTCAAPCDEAEEWCAGGCPMLP